ncbi:MAG: hypothetical protein NVSMB13_00030 [Mycobacteriales bacterium]
MSADLAAPDAAALETYRCSGAGWWPQGDPARLRTAATAWFNAATTLDAVADSGRRLAWDVRGSNSGDAVDAFGGFWARAEAHLAAAAAGAKALARACEDYAHAVDRARFEIRALRSAEVAVAVIGLVASVVTFGASEVAAGAAALGTLAAIEVVQATLIETVFALVGRVAVTAAASAAYASVEDLVVQSIRLQYDPSRPIDWGETSGAAGHGAEVGAALGVAGEATRLLRGLRTQGNALPVAAGPVPFGFADMPSFGIFGERLHAGLSRAGYADARGILQGSGVTGISYATKAAFDVGRTSDLDVALAGRTLFDAAVEAGMPLRAAGSRTGPLSDEQQALLGLSNLRAELTSLAGHPVSFMIYRSSDGALARGPSIEVPGW